MGMAEPAAQIRLLARQPLGSNTPCARPSARPRPTSAKKTAKITRSDSRTRRCTLSCHLPLCGPIAQRRFAVMAPWVASN
jgi:hypothetical protein